MPTSLARIQTLPLRGCLPSDWFGNGIRMAHSNNIHEAVGLSEAANS